MVSNRWITADRIHNGKAWMPFPTYILIDAAGCILKIQALLPDAEVEYFEGWICPGFVNVHCHLELSHLKGLIPKHTGLIPFVQQVVQYRTAFSELEKEGAIAATLQLSRQKGIVAFGDICNTTDTISAKAQSDLYFHSFIESMGKVERKSTASFEYANATFQAFQQQLSTTKSQESIVPHAPYSVSDALFQLIDSFDSASIISIHSQETMAEEELFVAGSGPMLDFYAAMGIPITCAEAKGYNSLQWILKQVSDAHPLILVHNTFVHAADMEAVKKRAGLTFFCLCPNANIYIENTLPPIQTLHDQGLNICIGTDSLASNDTICMLSELQIIHQHFPAIDWETLLSLATSQGAKALGIDDHFGEIAIGKAPGLVWIDASRTQSKRID